MTPVALALWAQGDGTKRNRGFTFNTQCFTLQQAVLLLNVLHIKFELDCTIYYDRGKPLVHVRSNSNSLSPSPTAKVYEENIVTFRRSVTQLIVEKITKEDHESDYGSLSPSMEVVETLEVFRVADLFTTLKAPGKTWEASFNQLHL